MRKILIFSVLLLSVFVVIADNFETIKRCKGELIIADSIKGGDIAIRNLALKVGLSNPNLKIEIGKTQLDAALEALNAGKVDIVLADQAILPKAKYVLQKYAAEVALVVVNIKNSKVDYTLAELKSIFSSGLNDWSTLNGSSYSLHRMGVNTTVAGAGVFERMVMGDRNISKNVYRKDNLQQILILTASNANTIAFIGYPDIIWGDKVREAGVNGVIPSVENIKNGKYPLVGYRVAIIGKKVNFQTRIFMQLLNSNEFEEMLRTEDLMPL